MAVNCWVAPTTRIDKETGVTAMEVSGITVRLMDELAIPAMDALIFVLPGSMPKASPDSLMVHMEEFELVHVTREVTFLVEPSQYVPVAVNCWVEPTPNVSDGAGDTVMEDSDATANRTGGLVTASKDASMMVVPDANPKAL